MEIIRLDPTSEYFRKCEYLECCNSFMADHILRKYCPEKYGTKNYCKNRQKRINDKNKEKSPTDKVRTPFYSLPDLEEPILNSGILQFSLTDIKTIEVCKNSISKQTQAEQITNLFHTAAKNSTKKIPKAELERVFKIPFLDKIVQTEDYIFRRVFLNYGFYTLE